MIEKNNDYKSITPLNGRVLILPEKSKSETASGILLPESSVKKPSSGVVVSVHNNGNTVKEGDLVLYGVGCGSEINMKGVKHLIIKEIEIFGIIG